MTEWTDDMTDDPPLTVADISSSGGIQQADFSNLYGVLMSNRSADRSVDEDLVLGDNNTAFVTDGYSVTSFSPADLSQYWSYTTTGRTRTGPSSVLIPRTARLRREPARCILHRRRVDEVPRREIPNGRTRFSEYANL